MSRSWTCLCLSASVCIVSLAMSGCCCSGDSADHDAACNQPKAGTVTTVNTVCVVNNNDEVDPAMEPVVWNGQKVGFCCAGCVKKWDKMSPQQKDAAVAKAISLSKR